MTWPEPVQRVSAALRAAAVDARIEEFRAGRTARDAARAIGADLSQIVKSLVFVADGAFVVALLPGDCRADEASGRDCARRLDGAHGVGREEVIAATGFEPGAVAPFPLRPSSRCCSTGRSSRT